MAGFSLQSPDVVPGRELSTSCTCDGARRSPDIRWVQPPEGTRSFVLVIDDPDAPSGLFTHWLVYDIPSDLRQLAPGRPDAQRLPREGTQGRNDYNRMGYGPPCPPPGDGPHSYTIRLYALDSELGLPPGADRRAVMTAMQGHIIATTELIAPYARQPTTA